MDAHIELDETIDNYRLLVVLPPIGHRCGYVGIPAENNLYGKHYDDIVDEQDIEVHGGLTYAENGRYFDDLDRWYIGFDCGHAYDAPDLEATRKYFKEVIDRDAILPINKNAEVRTFDYVKKEVYSLYNQLKAHKIKSN